MENLIRWMKSLTFSFSSCAAWRKSWAANALLPGSSLAHSVLYHNHSFCSLLEDFTPGKCNILDAQLAEWAIQAWSTLSNLLLVSKVINQWLSVYFAVFSMNTCTGGALPLHCVGKLLSVSPSESILGGEALVFSSAPWNFAFNCPISTSLASIALSKLSQLSTFKATHLIVSLLFQLFH